MFTPNVPSNFSDKPSRDANDGRYFSTSRSGEYTNLRKHQLNFSYFFIRIFATSMTFIPWVSTLHESVIHIFGVGAAFQMIGITARRVITFMHKIQWVRIIPSRNFEHHSSRINISSENPHDAVSMRSFCALPRPTLIWPSLVYKLPKPTNVYGKKFWQWFTLGISHAASYLGNMVRAVEGVSIALAARLIISQGVL